MPVAEAFLEILDSIEHFPASGQAARLDQSILYLRMPRLYMIREPTIADAILDRVIHNVHGIALEGDSMRRQKTPSHLTGAENGEINRS